MPRTKALVVLSVVCEAQIELTIVKLYFEDIIERKENVVKKAKPSCTHY